MQAIVEFLLHKAQGVQRKKSRVLFASMLHLLIDPGNTSLRHIEVIG